MLQPLFQHHFCLKSPKVVFADALHEEADNLVQRLEDVDKRRDISLDYSNPVFPQIPGEFWEKVNRENNKTAGKRGGLLKDLTCLSLCFLGVFCAGWCFCTGCLSWCFLGVFVHDISHGY